MGAYNAMREHADAFQTSFGRNGVDAYRRPAGDGKRRPLSGFRTDLVGTEVDSAALRSMPQAHLTPYIEWEGWPKHTRSTTNGQGTWLSMY